MKKHPKNKPLTFGDFIADVYQLWGKRRAKGIVKLAVNMRLIEFRGTKWFVIS
jgi:hypothetical protein